MASSFEKSVKGATKIKAAPPKTKYIEHILVATHSGEHGVAEVFRALVLRLREPTWTIVLKGLITVHLMIREGSPDTTLAYLSKHQNILAVNTFSDAQLHGRSIRHYANYLAERSRSYRDTKIDWVRTKESRLEKLTVNKGLLRETEVVQRQLTGLLKCDVMDEESENEITITIFRLLVLDLLALFQVLNQAMINILGHFFEMSKPDADRAMAIYRTFTKQTDFVVQYLSVARQYEYLTRVEVPKLKHAPVTLGRQLEDYLKDPDFDLHRAQFLLEKENKKKGGKLMSKAAPSKSSTSKQPEASSTSSSSKPASQSQSQSESQPQSTAAASNGPDVNLIDFFDNLDDHQTTVVIQQPNLQQQQQQMGTSPWGANTAGAPFQQMQPTGFVAPNVMSQPTGVMTMPVMPAMTSMQPSGYGAQPQQVGQVPQQLQPQSTAAGFGGFTPQPQPQPQPQSTGFVPASLAPIPQNATVSSFQQNPGLAVPQAAPVQQPMTTGSTNPFRKSMLMAQQTGAVTPQGGPANANPGGAHPSTNPFAKSSPQQAQPSNSPFSQAPQGAATAASPLQPTPTGTNPFAKNFSAQRPIPPATTTGAPATTAAPSLAPQATGTNPFRQGAFVNHTTGMGWQHGQQNIGGGLDHLESVDVFPRPAAQTPWQG